MVKLHGKVFKYAGPPGTGKSTTLLNEVSRLLESGVQPEDIIYTTFTRAGAYEARDRAAQRFNLPIARLPYFRTLHSLCYQGSGGSVMSGTDWCTIAAQLGLFFTVRFGFEEGIPTGRSKGDHMLSAWSWNRVTRNAPRKEDLSVSKEEYDHFVATVENYKKTYNKIDYTDMLENWIKDAPVIHSDYLIVDEAQDLSQLQWEVIQKLSTHAKETHIAGDDDQAIHEWNGASPGTFIELASDEFQVLPRSYRIPRSVHVTAQTVIGSVSSRISKDYQPREEEGQVDRLASLDQVNLSNGSWLLLARNNCFLEDYTAHCDSLGLLYKSVFGDKDSKILSAIHHWNCLLKGAKLLASDCKIIYGFMSQRDRVTRGCKTLLNAVDDNRLMDLAELRKDFGLVTELLWPLALDLIPEDRRLYLEAVEKKEGLLTKPRIEISTIHGAKGKEADHVLIRPDMTYRTYEAFQSNPDAEHRVWYVGVTRARKSLHILNPQSNYYYTI